MEKETGKCVIVLEEGLPPGLAVNTAAILGITVGMQRPEVVGEAVADAAGTLHAGIIRFPVPVLKADGACLKSLRARLRQPPFDRLTAVDFTQLAQRCKTYAEYTAKMSAAGEDQLQYIGLALCGERKTVDRLTGSLPLLR